jgi:ribulose kinase
MDKKLLSKNCDTIGVDAITSLLIVNTSDNTVSTMKELINNQTSVVIFLRHFA